MAKRNQMTVADIIEASKDVENGASVFLQWAMFFFIFAGISLFFGIMLAGFELILFGLILAIPGFLFLRMSNSYKRKRQYIALIKHNHVTSLDTMASAVNSSYDTVVKDINSMISKGMLDNVYVDTLNRQLVFPEDDTTTYAKPAIKQATCPSCGATCEVRSGKNSFCEYCGAPLQ